MSKQRPKTTEKRLNKAGHINTKLIDFSEICQKNPAKSAVFYWLFLGEVSPPEISCEISRFFREFAPKNPTKFPFFFCEIPEALKKSRKVEAVVTSWQTERMIRCSVKCQLQTKPKTREWADDKLKKKASWKKLNAKSNPVFLSLHLLLVGFLLDVPSIIYAKNFQFDDSRATRLLSRRKQDATGNLLLNGTVLMTPPARRETN